jgi:hypothetical protein
MTSHNHQAHAFSTVSAPEEEEQEMMVKEDEEQEIMVKWFQESYLVGEALIYIDT